MYCDARRSRSRRSIAGWTRSRQLWNCFADSAFAVSASSGSGAGVRTTGRGWAGTRRGTTVPKRGSACSRSYGSCAVAT